jgi:hypothetical protein
MCSKFKPALRAAISQIVLKEGDRCRTGLCAGTREHGFGEINRGDARTSSGPMDGMTSSTATKVRHVQTGYITRHCPDVLSFQ